MHNYYNILPTILIDVLIILIFEGLLFFLYLEKQQENIISNQLNEFMNKLYQNTSSSQDQSIKQLITIAEEIMKPHIKTSMENEEKHNTSQYKLGLIIYFCMLLAIIITLLIYSFIVIKKLGKIIDWKTVLITVGITIFLIIILELLYVKYVLFKKKFNESQIKLDFINALIS